MIAWQRKNSLLFIILLGLMLAGYQSRAQIYGATGFPLGLWNVQIDGCNCNLELIGPMVTSTGEEIVAEGDLSLCPEGTLFTNDLGEMFAVDPATALCTRIPGMPVLPVNNWLGGLACAGNGILYGAEELGSGKELYRFDINALTITSLGLLPYDANHGMFFHNGDLYMMANQGLVLVDTVNPPNSSIVFPFPAGYHADGATVYGSCDMVLIHGNDEYWAIMSLLDGTIIRLCPTPHYWMSLTGTYEFSPPECTVSIDLDCDNSSGAADADFNSPHFSCLTPNGVPIADTDVVIRSLDPIAEMIITISSSFMPDGSDEMLDVTNSVPPLNIVGEGSDQLTITNPGGAGTLQDFIDALHAVVYINAAGMLTEGERVIEVSFMTINDDESNLALAYVNVDDLPLIQVDLGPDVTICDSESVTFTAGNAGSTYAWSNNQTGMTLTTGDAGTYSVTVSNNVACPNADAVDLVVYPDLTVNLTGDNIICDNETGSLIITVSTALPVDIEIQLDPAGPPILLNNVITTEIISVTPSVNTEYTILSLGTPIPVCLHMADSIQFIEILPTYHTTVDTTICEGDSVWIGTYWQTNAGVYGATYQSVDGCDSVVTTTIAIEPAEMIFIQLDTCDPDAVGVFVVTLPNPDGCDTVVTTTVTLLAADTTHFSVPVCAASNTGVEIDTSSNVNGCDSLVITTYYYVPPIDTTQISQSTCDSNAAGTNYQVMTAADGCDSLLAIVSVYLPPDTTYISGTSCIASEIGVFETLLTNIDDCDSLIITTITQGNGDTTYLADNSCDPASVGIFETLLLSSTGCDSLIITTVTFAAEDSTFIFGNTCDPLEAGVFVNVFVDHEGCDSIVTETITLRPSSLRFIDNSSCHPADTGMLEQYFLTTYGCDSIIVTTTSLLPSHAFSFEEQTCVLADTGTFISVFINQFGCDSIINQHITYSSTDTTVVVQSTCDPDNEGVTETLLVTTDGCDSLVVTTTAYTPVSVAIEIISDYNGFPVSCPGGSDGSIEAEGAGNDPFEYNWSTMDTGPTLSGIPGGTYAVTATDRNGCTASNEIALSEPEELSLQFVVNEPSCFGDGLGFITAVATGGVLPFTYSLDGTTFQDEATFTDIPEGAYAITAMDANGCSIIEYVLINQLLQVHVTLGEDMELLFGDTTLVKAIVNIPLDSLDAIQWTGIAEQACPTCLTQQVAPLMTTSYFIEVESVDGCVDADTIAVTVEAPGELFVPNIFSPNGDGINDQLIIQPGTTIRQIISFIIFDRWGNMVFDAGPLLDNQDEVSWDGSYAGKLLNPGVFTYRMEIHSHQNETQIRYGDITLVR